MTAEHVLQGNNFFYYSVCVDIHLLNNCFLALEKLGYGEFKKEAEEALAECKDVAAKKRRQSTRLENLGIPEEELLRQQQELFAKAREAAALQEQQMSTQHLQSTSAEASTSHCSNENQISSS